MKRTRLFSFLFVLTLTFAVFAGPPAFQLDWHTVDGGGGTSMGGGFTLSGTAGQHDAGVPLTGGDFTLTGGFWSGVGINCIGDTDNDGDVDVDDLGTVFIEWDTAGPAGDVDYDGDVDVDDLGIIFIHWGPCP